MEFLELIKRHSDVPLGVPAAAGLTCVSD